MPRPDWYPEWSGETVVIVASGPSAGEADLDFARGLGAKFIAVNNSWLLCPWADALYACDWKWWKAAEGCPQFLGLKVTIDPRAAREYDLHKLQCPKTDDRMEFETIGKVGWGGNSGFNAFNFAVQLMPAKILLVGFDMSLASGMHWHGPHSGQLGNPREGQLGRWRRAMDTPAQQIAERRITVINCSLESRLRNYPKMSLAEAFDA